MKAISSEDVLVVEDPKNPPGIVILDRWPEPIRPAIVAFIWGGKVRPVPALPYGK